MKLFWTSLLVLALAGVAALLLLDSRTEEAIPETVSSSEPVRVPQETVPQVPAKPMAATAAEVPAPPPAAAGDLLSIGLDAKIAGATIRPGKLVKQGDAILADGKFLIRGDGSSERPYEITWDLLMSASDTYIPRLGEKAIPQRVAMLHDAHVTISGFIAFPLIATESSECLVMLNQWDGCCLGVPPSPYDAIEAKLSIPADNSKRHVVRVGSLEGVLHIDPYVVEKWLVGLYTMDQATLATDL